MIWLAHNETGAIQGVLSMDGIDETAWTPCEEPPPPVPRRSAEQIFKLLTVGEHSALRDLPGKVFPEGHARAGDLIDPLKLMPVAFDRLAARREPLPLNDGDLLAVVSLGVAAGILTIDRAAAVLAGQPPEE